MLTRYRHITSALPFVHQTLHPRPIYAFSFKRLSEDMEFRRKMRYDMGESNFKAKQKRKRIHERAYDYVLNNKKKLTMFFVLCGILNFYVGYKGLVKFARQLDSVKLQLKIWFLGEKQFIPDSIEETFMSGEGIKLNTDTINSLSNLFVETDRQLKYGVNKKFLAKLYSGLNCFSSNEEKNEFYRESVYYKRQNQELNGLSLKQFLLLFQAMLKKLRKADSSIGETELLRRLQSIWDEAVLETQVWEREISKKRAEATRDGIKHVEERQKLFKSILKYEPELSLEAFNRRVQERSQEGLNLREQVEYLESQLKRLSRLRADLIPKGHSFSLDATHNNDKDRERELVNKIHEIENKLEELRINFRRTFEKSVKYGEVS